MKFLGTITVSATNTKDNITTPVPFAIPGYITELVIQSDIADVFVGLVLVSGGALPTTNGLKLITVNDRVSIKLSPTSNPKILSVNNPTGSTANVKVFFAKS